MPPNPLPTITQYPFWHSNNATYTKLKPHLLRHLRHQRQQTVAQKLQRTVEYTRLWIKWRSYLYQHDLMEEGDDDELQRVYDSVRKPEMPPVESEAFHHSMVPRSRFLRTTAVEPPLHLTSGGPSNFRYLDHNRRSHHPKVRDQRLRVQSAWLPSEERRFVELFKRANKDFVKIARAAHCQTRDVVKFYYVNKQRLGLKRYTIASGDVEELPEGPEWNAWTELEKERFADAYVNFGKNFRRIALVLKTKTVLLCKQYYQENHADLDAMAARYGRPVSAPKPVATASAATRTSSKPSAASRSATPRTTPARTAPARTAPARSQPVKPPAYTCSWTDDQKSFFVALFSTYGRNWNAISEGMGPAITSKAVSEFYLHFRQELDLDNLLPEGVRRTRRTTPASFSSASSSTPATTSSTSVPTPASTSSSAAPSTRAAAPAASTKTIGSDGNNEAPPPTPPPPSPAPPPEPSASAPTPSLAPTAATPSTVPPTPSPSESPAEAPVLAADTTATTNDATPPATSTLKRPRDSASPSATATAEGSHTAPTSEGENPRPTKLARTHPAR